MLYLLTNGLGLPGIMTSCSLCVAEVPELDFNAVRVSILHLDCNCPNEIGL